MILPPDRRDRDATTTGPWSCSERRSGCPTGRFIPLNETDGHLTYSADVATLSWMTARELLDELQHLPRDLEVLAFEAGCEDYCEREVDDYLEPWKGLPSRAPRRA
jgi:hypothetical protein